MEDPKTNSGHAQPPWQVWVLKVQASSCYLLEKPLSNGWPTCAKQNIFFLIFLTQVKDDFFSKNAMKRRFNPFSDTDDFWHLCCKQILKIIYFVGKRNLLKTSHFFFSHNVFNHQTLSSNGLIIPTLNKSAAEDWKHQGKNMKHYYNWKYQHAPNRSENIGLNKKLLILRN